MEERATERIGYRPSNSVLYSEAGMIVVMPQARCPIGMDTGGIRGAVLPGMREDFFPWLLRVDERDICPSVVEFEGGNSGTQLSVPNCDGGYQK